MAAPAFLTCFPVYCPHIPAHASEKTEGRHFPHVAAEGAKQRHRASEKRHGCKTQRKAAYPRTSGISV